MIVLSEFPEMEKGYSFTIPSVDLRDFMESKNLSVLITPSVEDEVLASQTEPDYEQFLADVWVGIVLTLMVLSCVCCMCSCLLYHKFQQWKRGVTEARAPATVESGFPEAELPSYTIASGLPSYEEALEQLKKVKELKTTRRNYTEDDSWVPRTPPTPVNVSVLNLFQIHRNSCPEIVVKL